MRPRNLLVPEDVAMLAPDKSKEIVNHNVAVVGGDYTVNCKSFDTTGYSFTIDNLSFDDIVNFDCVGLGDTGKFGIEVAEAADRLLSLIIENFDQNNRESHKMALSFLMIALLATKSYENPTLVAWDDNNFVIMDFSKMHTGMVASAKLSELKSNKTLRSTSCEFSANLLQIFDVSDSTLELMEKTLGAENIVVDDEGGFVTLKIE